MKLCEIVKKPFKNIYKKGLSMFIHQTLESSRYLEHRPVFLQPPQVCLQSRDKGVAFPPLKEGTHGGHTADTHMKVGRTMAAA